MQLKHVRVQFNVVGLYTRWSLLIFISVFGLGSIAHSENDTTPVIKTKAAVAASKLPGKKVIKVAKVLPAKKKIVLFTQAELDAKKPAAAAKAPVGRAPASLSTGISDSQKSLEIRGQSRNLSMLLVLKNRHENIDFVKPRESYREEIQQTGF